MIERRKFIRLKAPIGVVYKLVQNEAKPAAANPSLVKDISGGGVRIMVKEVLRTGDLLELQIQIPHLADPIRAVGEVAWFSQWHDAERQIREAGLRFRDIKPHDLHRILEYVYTIGIG
ncbi:MAG: PilZ domain-containing protein [Candidatus Omnitrophica bacterium]|nr:PilZ domain-containing protein [Candidatus Omnitrophota bacterium]